MPARTRWILHVDMDAFYASVEQRDDPSLRGRALVVGGGGGRGVVAAASYEARRYGVRSAMPMHEARQRCPELVQVPARMEVYRDASRALFAIFHAYTPEVEGLSLDEAFLDVSASVALFGPPQRIAADIKRRIRDELGLTASVGIAPNKLVAKIASDLDKPDGLTLVTPERLHAVLDPLPVAVLPGLGPRTLPRLHAIGIRTLGELRTAPLNRVAGVLGREAERHQARAAGHDTRPVTASRAPRSISSERTFDTDLERPADLARELARQADRAAARLREKGLVAGVVQIKVREHDFTTHTRQHSLPAPAQSGMVIAGAARVLLDQWLAARADPRPPRIRLLGVGVSALGDAAQLGLFDAQAPRPAARRDEALDSVRARFGGAALAPGRTLDPQRRRR